MLSDELHGNYCPIQKRRFLPRINKLFSWRKKNGGEEKQRRKAVSFLESCGRFAFQSCNLRGISERDNQDSWWPIFSFFDGNLAGMALGLSVLLMFTELGGG
jgi:hypothetical protein